MKRQHLIFAYGSLRQGHGNHHLLEGAYYYGTGRTLNNYAMYMVSGYPYVTSSEARYPITGELYGVDEDTLEKLDKMEGHPRYYVRKETAVLIKGEPFSAWMYIRDPQGILMVSGDYNDEVNFIR